MKIEDINYFYTKLVDILPFEGEFHSKICMGFTWNITLGELIIKTNNLKTHRYLRNIGDKKAGLLFDAIRNTKEYKQIQCFLEE